MSEKVTTYSAGFEGDPRHMRLVMLGSWQSEEDAKKALANVMGWDDVHLTEIFQVSFEVAAFGCYPTEKEAKEAKPPYVGAPRLYQHNALVVPA